MHKLKNGILIAIEGIDGSGKSSLAKNLCDQLLTQHYPVLLTKEPGGTPLGLQLRTIVQEKKVAVCPKAEFMLFATDRAQHFHELIIPALTENKIIISDRMADSSLVYQGYGRGLDREAINAVNNFVMNGIKPTVTIYVKVKPNTAIDRILKRGAQLTSFEKEEGGRFIERLSYGFDQLYKNREDVIIVDGNQTQEQVLQETLAKLLPCIKKQAL
jgi:dTMP kinase